ncbi:MAG: FtsQ-type POTRA domain-containing protein [Alphaproteobacteria bacterium]|nr:FtsQ-type POTRA domain-containing protein [Alphaproteobacteria bacterium]
MRFLKRRASEKQPAAAQRRRPFPTAAVVLGLGATSLIAAGAAGYWLWRDGAIIRTGGAIEARLLAIGARHGVALENVDVVGRRRQSVASILAALHVRRGMPMFDIDLDAAKARLEALPWIRTADVGRQLPDTLFIRLTERVPFAFWQRNGGLSLIDRDGTVIPTDDLAQYGPLIVLVGDDAAVQAASLIDMLATEPALARRVNAAVRYGARRWTLRFDTGVDAALPETDALAAWQRLAGLEAQDRILERNIAAIDLRLPDRLVVRLAPADATRRPGARGSDKAKSS